jgi:hypothetical protein
VAARRGRQFVGVRHRERDHEVERTAGAVAEQRRVAVLAERLLRRLDRLLVKFLHDGRAAEPLVE